MKLRPAQGQVGDGNVGGLVLEPDEVGLRVHALGGHLGIGQGPGRRLPRRGVSEDGLVHAGALQGHAGLQFQRRLNLEGARRQFNCASFGAVPHGGDQRSSMVNHGSGSSQVEEWHGEQRQNESVHHGGHNRSLNGSLLAEAVDLSAAGAVQQVQAIEGAARRPTPVARAFIAAAVRGMELQKAVQ